MKARQIILFVTLLALLVAVASASEVSTDTTSTPATVNVSSDAVGTDTTPTVVEDTTPTTTGNFQESVTSKQTKNNEITKEEKNKKTAAPINVGKFSDLQSAFGSSDNEVTVNITANITLTGSLSTSIKNLTIEGNGFTINGSDQHQFLNIPRETTVTINNLTITNCHSINYGGAINNKYGTLTITNSNLTQNNATGAGGEINNDQGTLTINNSNFNYNTATGSGGAIRQYYGTLNITDSNLTHNNATDGGAIMRYYGTFNINNSNFNYNTAKNAGGAINNNAGTLTITNSNLYNNTATGQNGHGGAIYNGDTITITESNLKHNNAIGQKGYGGAIYTENRNLNINNSILEYNNATSGGAIYIYNTEAVIESNYFIANPSQMTGKAIINDTIAIIEDNEGGETSNYSGTIYTNSTKTVTIKYNKFYDKLNTTISISTNNTNPAIGDVINITFTLKDQLDRPITDENITITIKDYTTQKTTDITGTTSIEHTIKSNETLINTTYPGNNNYNTNTTTLLVTAPKIETKLIVDDVDTKVGQNFTITGTLLDKDNQALTIETVNITVNGTTQQATTNTTGQFNTTFTLDQMGEYPIIVIYPGTDIYNQSTNNTAKVTATKTDTQLTLNVSNSTPVNDTMITITVNLTDNTGEPLDNQEVNITIGEETFTINTTNGIASRQYTVNKLGTQTITASYYGNNMYNANSTTTQINVIKLDTKLTLNVSDNTPVNNTQVTITATLTDTANNKLEGKNITLNINGKSQTIATNSNGTVTQTYTPDKVGTQTITAVYNGDSQYTSSTKQSIDINVIKIDSKLTITVSNTTPINSTTINITVKLTDTNDNQLANQNMTIKVSDKTFTVKTNADGTATQSYTPTTLGKQTITATYNGDSKHTNSTATTTINVKKINTKLDLKVSNTTPVNSTPITITATLTDENNNVVSNQNITLKVSDQTFTVKTNNKGTATQTYTPTKVEKQTITATYNGDSKYTNSTKTTSITVKKINTLLELKVSNTTPVNNTPINIILTLTDANNNKLSNQQVTLNINGKTTTTKTNTNGTITQTYTPDKIGSQNITATYNGDSKYTNTTKTTSITVRNKYNTKTVTTSVTGTIGEKLTLTATVTDENNQKVTSGNLIFKINGVTIKDNGKLTGSNNPLKTKVTNGLATATITPDLNMVNSDKITASYIGTAIYNASTSTPASIKISKRNATIEITTNKKIVKQGQVLTITAKIYDTTGGKKSTNLAAYSDEFVYFKINGVTIKDENGQMLKVKVVNGVAKLNYTVPVGISCVLDTQSMTPKNHTIQVGFYNKNYQDIISNNPHFQVERSPITINIADATINNKTHKLSMKITIKDYLGNTVAGPNKLIIKVNGVTLKNGTQVMYYFTTDGVLDLKNTPVPQAKNYTTIEVITQDRLAYMSQRNMTSKVKVTN